MTGPPLFGISIALLIAIIVPRSDALTAAETCAITKNATYIGDPSSCQAWNYCIDGEVAYSGNCASGLLYDAASGDCDYADNVACTANTTTMCVGLTNVYKANPYSCEGYIYCKDGVTYYGTCGGGQYFNLQTTTCIYREDSTCVANSPCTLSQNGFIQNATSCNGWIRCFNGQVAASDVCPPKLYYNPNTASCDYPSNVQCTVSSPPGVSTPVQESTPTTCTDVTGTNQFVAANTTSTCRGYFFCTDSTDKKAVFGLCPINFEFNPSNSQCNDPTYFACTGNRCEGTTNKWMTVPGTGCKEFTYCQNGLTGTPTTCTNNYYFNEATQNCEPTLPGSNICK